ncbi:MAG: hypothetical protein RMY34_17720 [Aulosira sp. DedQUE10]|nr:hypothetical protein [Aulosira sp. DedQUE10]
MLSVLYWVPVQQYYFDTRSPTLNPETKQHWSQTLAQNFRHLNE